MHLYLCYAWRCGGVLRAHLLRQKKGERMDQADKQAYGNMGRKIVSRCHPNEETQHALNMWE